MLGDRVSADSGGPAGQDAAADSSSSQDSKARPGDTARAAAAARRAAIAHNDAEHVWTKASSYYVKCGMRAGKLDNCPEAMIVKSIAEGLAPPYGISIAKLRKLYRYEIKNGAAELARTLEIQAFNLLRDPNTPPAVKPPLLKMLRPGKQTPDPKTTPAARTEREVVVKLKPVIDVTGASQKR